MPTKRVMVLAGNEEETPIAAILQAAAQPSSKAAIVAVASPFRHSAALGSAASAGVSQIVLGDGKFSEVAFDMDLGDDSGGEQADGQGEDMGKEFCNVLEKEMESMQAEMLLILDDVDCTLLTKDFLARRAGKVLKVQASLLPAFPGNASIEAAIRSGACITGCSVCFAVQANCLGPIIAQEPIRIRPEDTAGSLRARLVAECEAKAVPQALQAVTYGSVSLDRDEGGLGLTKSPSYGAELEMLAL